MAVYGVTVADIAAELPSLFATGFSAATKPTAAQVLAWIEIADQVIQLHVRDVTGVTPALTDAAAGLAKEFVVNRVIGKIMRAIYAGRAPEQVQSAAAGYYAAAKELYDAITELGSQAAGTGAPSPNVAVPTGLPVRDLIVSDAELDGCDAFRFKRF